MAEETKDDNDADAIPAGEATEVAQTTSTTEEVHPTEAEIARELEKARIAKEGQKVVFNIQETKEEIGDLTSENKVLEKRLLSLQKRRSTIGTKLFLEGAETLYQTRLLQWRNLKEEIDRLVLEYDERIEQMQEEVRNKQDEAKAMRTEFLDFKWKLSMQMAREAEHSITGKPLKPKLLTKLQNEEEELDAEIENLRIQGKQLRTQLKKLEQALWKKEQLPGGLHLVDFEQLKIENESLNEKLSKKNDELFQLKKKSTHVVHVLSHVREKLQFIDKETESDAKSLEAVDTELISKRKELHKVKSMCKNLRAKMAKMQEDVVNVVNPALLDDLEMQKENEEAFERKIRELKARHALLTKKMKELQRQVQDSLLGNYALGRENLATNTNTNTDTDANTNTNTNTNTRWGVKRDILRKRC